MLGHYILIFLVAVIAFALSAICGGGASFLLLPLLNWVLPGAQVPAALSIGTATSSISRMAIFYRNIRWDIVIWFVPPALPAVYAGAKLLTMIDPVLLELVLGIFLVINLPFVFKPAIKSQAIPAKGKWILSLIGLATGFLSGLTGAVGLLFNRFYLTYGLTKEQIIATRAANELLLHILKIILYALFGLLTARTLGMGLIVALAAIVSAQLLKYVVQFFTEKLYQRIGFIAMVASGVIMLINSGFTLYKDNSVQFAIHRADDQLNTKIKWKETIISMEFAFDEGIEIERVIGFNDLPVHLQERASSLIKGRKLLMLEEVYKYKDHYHELYIDDAGTIIKYNLR